MSCYIFSCRQSSLPCNTQHFSHVYPAISVGIGNRLLLATLFGTRASILLSSFEELTLTSRQSFTLAACKSRYLCRYCRLSPFRTDLNRLHIHPAVFGCTGRSNLRATLYALRISILLDLEIPPTLNSLQESTTLA